MGKAVRALRWGSTKTTWAHTIGPAIWWTKKVDGMAIGPKHAVKDVTLDQCRRNCWGGEWGGCRGFSRHTAIPAGSKDTCWWVPDVQQLKMDDVDNDETIWSFAPGAFLWRFGSLLRLCYRASAPAHLPAD